MTIWNENTFLNIYCLFNLICGQNFRELSYFVFMTAFFRIKLSKSYWYCVLQYYNVSSPAKNDFFQIVQQSENRYKDIFLLVEYIPWICAPITKLKTDPIIIPLVNYESNFFTNVLMTLIQQIKYMHQANNISFLFYLFIVFWAHM